MNGYDLLNKFNNKSRLQKMGNLFTKQKNDCVSTYIMWCNVYGPPL